jgi:uncharacterized protein (TIGR00730 family)
VSASRICVYAGAASGASPRHADAAERLGAELARRGWGMVYGGGSIGLMGVAADAALAAGAEVIGVIPRFLHDREVTHGGLTELRVTESMHARKLLMADLADGFVALPGGIGTLEEVVEMLSWLQLGLHAKPIGLLDVDGFWAPLKALLAHLADAGFVAGDPRALMLVDPEPAVLLDAMADWRAPRRPRWLQHPEET